MRFLRKLAKSKVASNSACNFFSILSIFNCLKFWCSKKGIKAVFSFIMRLLGPILIVFLTVLVLGVYLLYVVYIMPTIFYRTGIMVTDLHNALIHV